MDLNPPAGSKISIVSEGADPTIIIPAASSPMRYFTGLVFAVLAGRLGFRIRQRREWLARLLAQRYSLPQVLATPAPAN